MRGATLGRLIRDRRGNTIVEFGFVAPIMVMVLMGLGEVLYQPYLQSILSGAVQKAGRDSTIEDSVLDKSVTDGIDAKVVKIVSAIAKGAEFKPERKSFSSFGLIKPEQFTDSNGNNRRDAGECFDDINGNKTWDARPGRDGQGGADDVTEYTMTVTYKRVFPVAKLIGLGDTNTISAKTILKNQPFDAQKAQQIERVCT